MTSAHDRASGFYNRRLETLTPDERKEYHERKLREIVRHAYGNAAAIRKKFDASGVGPEQIKTIEDLQRLPITPKQELASLQQQAPPFGGFLGVSLDRIRRICMSPGPIYEPEPIESENDRWTQAFFAAGFRKGDVGQITFSYHLVPPAFWFEEALNRLGCIATPGGVGNTELQVRMMHDLKVTGFVGTPSFLMSLLKKAQQMGYDPKVDLNLEVGFVAGEMLPDSLRNDLEGGFGMIVRQGYGTADVGCLAYECYEKKGMHFPYDCIVEIVDPDTGRQLGPGETGEIVATVFDKAYPMIRFGTGDLSYRIDEPCSCGRTARRLARILGRLDQVTKVKGMFIHPANVDDVAAEFAQIERCQVVVTREDHVDQMVLACELAEGCELTPALEKRIESAVAAKMRVRGVVRRLERGSLPAEYKKIDDRRKWN